MSDIRSALLRLSHSNQPPFLRAGFFLKIPLQLDGYFMYHQD